MTPFLFIFHIFITYIHSFNHIHYNTFIRRHSPGLLSISSSLVSSVGKTSMWSWAENRTRACLTASRRATNWAKPHHLSHAASYWATPHHTEPRCTILSHAAPFLATPHHPEPRRTILSHAAPFCAAPHHWQICMKVWVLEVAQLGCSVAQMVLHSSVGFHVSK